jgi:hypothetical protein
LKKRETEGGGRWRRGRPLHPDAQPEKKPTLTPLAPPQTNKKTNNKQGYGAYIATLYVVIVLVIGTVAGSAFLARHVALSGGASQAAAGGAAPGGAPSSSAGALAGRWPVRLLRVATTAVLQVFFVGVLDTLLSAAACRPLAGAAVRGHLEMFPTVCEDFFRRFFSGFFGVALRRSVAPPPAHALSSKPQTKKPKQPAPPYPTSSTSPSPPWPPSSPRPPPSCWPWETPTRPTLCRRAGWRRRRAQPRQRACCCARPWCCSRAWWLGCGRCRPCC